jgi:anti-sigma regulatory factor (Ser/Thr protein kinase)
MPDDRWSLRLNAELADLAEIRQFVHEAAAPAGLAPEDLSGVLLAVDEALTNVIIHGYAGRGGPVEIEIAGQPGKLVIHLRDAAGAFDPTGVPAPDLNIPLEERTPGGLGIHLMRQVMDQLTYRRRPDGGNELTMIKQVR